MADTEPAVQAALSKLGSPYVWGAVGPTTFDCSGLVQWAFKQAGIDVSRTTYTQVFEGQKVVGPPQRGDLVFPDLGHVMIALGGNQAVHAPETGDVVKISNYWTEPYAIRRLGTNSGTPGSATASPQFGASGNPSFDTFGGGGADAGIQNAIDVQGVTSQLADLRNSVNRISDVFSKFSHFFNFMVGDGIGWQRFLKVVGGTFLLCAGSWFFMQGILWPNESPIRTLKDLVTPGGALKQWSQVGEGDADPVADTVADTTEGTE